MTFSGNHAKALGKRLRSNDFSNADLEELERYRVSYDFFLNRLYEDICALLSKSGIVYVLAGRLKRGKSIIRKLRQVQNSGMDLSRMADIAGLRLLIGSLEEQNRVLDFLQNRIKGIRVKDTRDSLTYRSIHLIMSDESSFRLAEMQVRTLPQQLWADESECFGEEVKAGRGDNYVRSYLALLAEDCRALDLLLPVANRHLSHSLGRARLPVNLSLVRLRRNFVAAGSPEGNPTGSTSHIIVFDNQVQVSLQDLAYAPREREKALLDYAQLTKGVDESRIETLMLNAGSAKTLRATHPRFFPE